MFGAEWWEAAEALGTVGATVVALSLGLSGWAAGRRIARQGRHRTMSLVSSWVEVEYEPNADRSGYISRARVFVANESDEPVFKVHTVVGLGYDDDVVQLGTLAMPDVIASLPPRRTRSWDITMGILAHSSGRQVGRIEPLCSMSYSDKDGRRWHRDWGGSLMRRPQKKASRRSDKPQLSPLFRDNPEMAHRQLGAIDNMFNPMLLASAWTYCMTKEAEISAAEIKENLLAPIDAWKDFDEEALSRMRDVFDGYGMAAHCRYATSQVAYALFPHEDDSERPISEEGFVPVKALSLTMVFLPGSGWKVFAAGDAAIQADWIPFPRGFIVDDPRAGPEKHVGGVR